MDALAKADTGIETFLDDVDEALIAGQLELNMGILPEETGQHGLQHQRGGNPCRIEVNPRTVEAQVQGAALMGLSMCLPGSAITLKDGVVEQSNFGDFTVARITDMPEFDVHIVPSAEPPTGMGEPGLPPLAPAFANAIARLTGKPLRQLPFNLA